MTQEEFYSVVWEAFTAAIDESIQLTGLGRFIDKRYSQYSVMERVELTNAVISVILKTHDAIHKVVDMPHVTSDECLNLLNAREVADKKPSKCEKYSKSTREAGGKYQKAVELPATVKSKVDRAFDLSVINIDCNYPLNKIISGVRNFAEQLKLGKNKVKNCCILLSGKSGTGKSEFGRYLAEQVGIDLKIVRYSDLSSKWVGDTEKNIAQMFNEASDSNTMLLIDEADSIFADRAGQHQGWETSRTNEFLCQVEQFRGILICSTNMLNTVDKAVMRRFVFKIKLMELTPEGKQKLAKAYLSEVCILPEDLSKVSEIQDLRAGDFKTVRDRLLLVNTKKTSFEEALEELRLEVSYRDNNELVATL